MSDLPFFSGENVNFEVNIYRLIFNTYIQKIERKCSLLYIVISNWPNISSWIKCINKLTINIIFNSNNIISSVTHQSHVICQYSSTNSLWYFFGRETREAVIVELASLLPKGWQHRFVLPSTHPGQCLLLVRQERRTHRLQRKESCMFT